MAKIFLVSCASKKLGQKAPAQDMYVSPLFEKQKMFASERSDKWYILSAKYGLLDPRQTISSYDQTLNRMSVRERQEWASKVWNSLSKVLAKGDHVTILAGSKYREFLQGMLIDEGFDVTVPLEGLSIGRQLQWLALQVQVGRRSRDLDRFYSLLDRQIQEFGGYRVMGACSASLSWSRRGVYFFFEPNEIRRLCPGHLRVVRVGTHAVSRGSKSTLWGRLRTHRGDLGGGGNHRGSIFRSHVGAALMNRLPDDFRVKTWGVGQGAPAAIREAEAGMEKLVSEYIGRMSLVYVGVEDDPGPSSDRAYIEKNAIGLLSGPSGPFDPASADWLGNYSPHPLIRASALWNVRVLILVTTITIFHTSERKTLGTRSIGRQYA